jgi:cytoskeletal protein CcmA (bactofilin family)
MRWRKETKPEDESERGVMVLKKEERDRETGKINSIVGPGTKFTGDCDVQGAIRIDGEFEGKMKISKVVVVGKSGVVKGNIDSLEVIVGGKVLGTIIGQNRVELQAGAHIEGDIRTKSLIVDEGVFFHGECRMKEEKGSDIRVLEPEPREGLKTNN